ncbi:MAG: STAS domain-containing protein [Eubacterium sp.]|nr:STAS domain-containing protein [Eubacterium sp.]
MLNVEKKLNGSELVVEVGGRLDTSTSPELEKELKDSLGGIDKLVLDFAKLEYISSAGLRVLLATQKTINGQGEMKIINVSETIMEIFDMTGFSDILDIEE